MYLQLKHHAENPEVKPCINKVVKQHAQSPLTLIFIT